MDIEGLGYQTIMALIEQRVARRMSADIYFLQPDQLAELEGFGDKSIANLMAAIDASRHRPLPNVLSALGIPHVGVCAAQVLAQEVGSLDKLRTMSAEELEAIEGIGPVIAQAIASYFSERANLDVLDRLQEGGLDPEPPQGAGGGSI